MIGLQKDNIEKYFKLMRNIFLIISLKNILLHINPFYLYLYFRTDLEEDTISIKNFSEHKISNKILKKMQSVSNMEHKSIEELNIEFDSIDDFLFNNVMRNEKELFETCFKYKIATLFISVIIFTIFHFLLSFILITTNNEKLSVVIYLTFVFFVYFIGKFIKEIEESQYKYLISLPIFTTEITWSISENTQ